jgi:hypothetical protein
MNFIAVPGCNLARLEKVKADVRTSITTSIKTCMAATQELVDRHQLRNVQPPASMLITLQIHIVYVHELRDWQSTRLYAC